MRLYSRALPLREEDEPYIPEAQRRCAAKAEARTGSLFRGAGDISRRSEDAVLYDHGGAGLGAWRWSAFIGFILEISVEQEKDFYHGAGTAGNAAIPEAADEDWKSVADLVMEDHKAIVMLFDFCVLPGALPRQAAYLFLLHPDCENALRKSVRVRPLAFTGNPLRTVVKGESEA